MKKLQKVLALSVAWLVVVVVPGVAVAALPAEATTAFTTIAGYITDILAAIWPILAVSVGGFILIKLFKKGANKVA